MATYPNYLPFTEDTDYEAVWITVQMMYSDILNQGDGCCKSKGVINILDQVDGFLRDVSISDPSIPNSETANEVRWENSIKQAYLLLMGFFRLSANPDVRPTLRYIAYTNNTTSSFTFSNEEPHLAGTSGIQSFYTPRTIKITMTDDIAYKVNGVEYSNANPYTFELSVDVSVVIESAAVLPKVLNINDLTPGFLDSVTVSVDGGVSEAYEQGLEYLNTVKFELSLFPVLMQFLYLKSGSDKLISQGNNQFLLLDNTSPLFGVSPLDFSSDTFQVGFSGVISGGVNNAVGFDSSKATLTIYKSIVTSYVVPLNQIESGNQLSVTDGMYYKHGDYFPVFFSVLPPFNSYSGSVTINGSTYAINVPTEGLMLLVPPANEIFITSFIVNSFT